FGPTRDWECHCGKYKRVRYKGIVCDRCGVEVTRAKVRRERMGHIELAAPVSHIWFFKGIPSRMGLLLDMSPRALEKVLYFASYIVIDPGDTPLAKKQLLTESEYREYREKYGNAFRAGMGAEAIKELLAEVDLDELCAEARRGEAARAGHPPAGGGRGVPQVGQPAGVDDPGGHSGHPAGLAAHGAAGRRPFRHVRP